MSNFATFSATKPTTASMRRRPVIKDAPRTSKPRPLSGSHPDREAAKMIAAWAYSMARTMSKNVLVIVAPPKGRPFDWATQMLPVIEGEWAREVKGEKERSPFRTRVIAYNPAKGISETMLNSIHEADVVGVYGNTSVELRAMVVASGADLEDVEVAALLPSSHPV